MTRSELVKVRVTPRAKSALAKRAEEEGTTISDLMRDQMARMTAGGSTNPLVRADLMAVRRLANLVLASLGDSGASVIDAGRIASAAHELRAIAARHLEPTP